VKIIVIIIKKRKKKEIYIANNEILFVVHNYKTKPQVTILTYDHMIDNIIAKSYLLNLGNFLMKHHLKLI